MSLLLSNWQRFIITCSASFVYVERDSVDSFFSNFNRALRPVLLLLIAYWFLIEIMRMKSIPERLIFINNIHHWSNHTMLKSFPVSSMEGFAFQSLIDFIFQSRTGEIRQVNESNVSLESKLASRPALISRISTLLAIVVCFPSPRWISEASAHRQLISKAIDFQRFFSDSWNPKKKTSSSNVLRLRGSRSG